MEEQLKALITQSLSPHFKGRNAPERLVEATNDVARAISHLLRDEAKPRSGATVMTELASANKNIAPKRL